MPIDGSAADASRFQRVEGSEIKWSQEQRAGRAIQEYLAALESEIAPTNPKRKPKALSPTDPSAAWTSRGRNKVNGAEPETIGQTYLKTAAKVGNGLIHEQNDNQTGKKHKTRPGINRRRKEIVR